MRLYGAQRDRFLLDNRRRCCNGVSSLSTSAKCRLVPLLRGTFVACLQGVIAVSYVIRRLAFVTMPSLQKPMCVKSGDLGGYVILPPWLSIFMFRGLDYHAGRSGNALIAKCHYMKEFVGKGFAFVVFAKCTQCLKFLGKISGAPKKSSLYSRYDVR
jgi:hypothetical protein